MKKKCLHVGFNFNSAQTHALEQVFNQAPDWLRYAPNCWIIVTDESPEVWCDRIKPHLGKSDNVFVCELTLTNRQGWLPEASWEWIRKYQSLAPEDQSVSWMDGEIRLTIESAEHSLLVERGNVQGRITVDPARPQSPYEAWFRDGGDFERIAGQYAEPAAALEALNKELSRIEHKRAALAGF